MKGTIGDFFTVKGGKRLPKGTQFEEGKTPYPYLRVTDLGRNSLNTDKLKYISKQIQQKIARYTIRCSDVYISIAGTIGVAGIIPEKFEGANLTENAAKIAPKDNINVLPKYLAYYLNSEKVQEIIKSKTMAVGVPKLALFRIKEIPINLPSLAQQKEIATILDQADALRRKDQELLAKYDELVGSVFLEMFGDPMNNEKKWEEKKLKEVCVKITDGTHHSPPLAENGIPYVTAKHVKNYGLDFGLSPTFVERKYHEPIYARCNPEFGDILYIKDGATTGIACINTFKEEISMLSSLALIKPDKKQLDNWYLCHWLNNERVKEKLVRTEMAGAAIKRYTLKKIKEFKILIPPMSLQKKFASIIDNIELQKGKVNAQIAKSEELFQSLLQKAFRGEL